MYRTPRDLPQAPSPAAESPTVSTIHRTEITTGVSSYRREGRADVQPIVGFAAQLWALGTTVWVCARPAAPRPQDATIATGVMPIGGWR